MIWQYISNIYKYYVAYSLAPETALGVTSR